MTTTTLIPGTVLLHMTVGEISKLIAWANNGQYSHAAIYLGGDDLAEAVSAGTVIGKLSQRLDMRDKFRWIDAYVPATPFTDTDIQLVRDVAHRYLGSPYPLQELALLGVLCAARDKFDAPPLARWVMREAMNYLADVLDPGFKGLVCSEFVYRALAEAATAPPRRLAPRIVVTARAPQPFPDIDWHALYQEYIEASERARHTPAALPERVRDAALQPGPEPADEREFAELRALAARVRRVHGLAEPAAPRRERQALGLAQLPPVDLAPNPKTVTPSDLADSPSLRYAARVLMHA